MRVAAGSCYHALYAVGDDGEGKEHMDTLDFIMAYEDGDCDEDEIIAGFQSLIDSDLVWSLQGSYGRMAVALIEAGLCTPKGE